MYRKFAFTKTNTQKKLVSPATGPNSVSELEEGAYGAKIVILLELSGIVHGTFVTQLGSFRDN